MGKYDQEEHNMSSEIFSPKPTDNLGKGYFPETARKLPPTPPELPSVPKPPIEFPKRPETTPPPEPTSRRGLYARLAGTLLIAIATAGPAIDHHVKNETVITPDAIGRDVVSIPAFYADLMSRLTRKEATPNFDNTLDSSTIRTINSVVIRDLREIETIPTVPSGPNPKHDVNLLVPIKGLPTEGKLDYDKDFPEQNPSNPIYSPTETNYAKENNVRDKIIFKNIPKDTVIVAPTDGKLEFITIPERSLPGTLAGANLYYKGADGIMYQYLMGATNGYSGLKALINTEPFKIQPMVSLAEREKLWVPVKRGQPIMAVLETTDFTITGQAWPSGQLGVGRLSIYPVNINLITLPNPNRENKVAILEK